MKKLFLVLAAAVILTPVCQAAAQDAVKHEQEGQSSQAVNVGNKICPVSGEAIGQGGMQAATYEYQGKIYNFCCPMCIAEFKKDPEKYINKVNEELKSGQAPGSLDGK